MEKNRYKMKWIFLVVILFVLALPFIVYFIQQYQYNNRQKPFKEKFLTDSSSALPKFTAIDLAYIHRFKEDGMSMPFLDIQLIHPYDDDQVAIMETGGNHQSNGVLLFENGKFRDIAQGLNLEGFENEAAYSIGYADIDNDGRKEILVGYASGVFAYHRKSNGFSYDAPVKLFDVPDGSIPVDIAFSDVNDNGWLDMYVCTFVDRKNFTSATYHDKTNKRRSLFMMNNCDGTFTEKTKEAGLELIENAYLAKFVDFNGNGKEDLILALNTDVGRVYENLGGGKFKLHLLPMEYGFWMGLSVEKINDQTDKYSVLMSNIGKSYPVSIVRGDLKKDEIFDPHYVFLEQVEGFKFRNVTHEKNLNSNVFGWGLELVDLNNNGLKDAVLTENYIKFPANIHKMCPSKGKLFLQNSDGTFAPFQNETGLVNPYFGYRVLSHDFTGNGFKDVIIGNVNGPIRYFANQGI